MTYKQKRSLKLHTQRFSFLSIQVSFIAWIIHSIYYVLPTSDEKFLLNLFAMGIVLFFLIKIKQFFLSKNI